MYTMGMMAENMDFSARQTIRTKQISSGLLRHESKLTPCEAAH